MPPRTSRLPSERTFQFSLLVLFLALRVVVLWHYYDDLNADPDAYLVLARRVAAGHGLSEEMPSLISPSGVRDVATAYRPPLYPLMLAPISAPDQQLPRAILHLVLAAVTFLALWRTGTNLGLNRWQKLLANLLLTFDPLALRYIAFPMTETVCACLIALLMVVLTDPQPRGVSQNVFRNGLAGLVFGLCVLSRPTFWAFGMLYVPVWVAIQLFSARLQSKAAISQQHPSSSKEPTSKFPLKTFSISEKLACSAAVLAGVLLVVAPWVQRNWTYMHAPIVMTTHGGYTLLLGNNEAFYREVVDQPWGTIWDGSHGGGQEAWVNEMLAEAAREKALGPEVKLDRWMSKKAWETIRQEPGTFLRACVLKFCWFWNIGPHGPEAKSLSPVVLWGVRFFYLCFWTLVVVGMSRIVRRLFQQFSVFRFWLVPILLVASMTAVHLVYWSDARMRAPITPALALIAAAAVGLRREESAVN